ncbi:sialidase family protein [Kribbella sp.]|uniref:sialidase family protein n=1 Tax=Kribbella sp. TaxID=1871183 RepID=UPI002D5FF130|nr:sialidase family protein [Kribbella sp.]HZX07805.1 sialidase family protein [Kribbella sp.]
MPFTRRSFLMVAGSGTVSALLTTPATAARGRCRSATAPAVAVTGSIGFQNHDLNPTTGALAEWGVHVAYAADYDYRSIGIDVGTSQVNALAMTASRGPHGLNQRDWSIYTSADNAAWTKVTDVQLVDLGDQVWFMFPSQTRRYLKVHCHREFTDVARSTFILNDLQTGLTAYRLPMPALVAGGTGSWTTSVPVTVNNPTAATLRDRAVHVTYAQLGTTTLVAAGKLRGDLADLRFADGLGNYLHAYADADGVFVRIPSINAGQQLTIQAITGNPSARDVVHQDAAALQVEYGQRTLQRLDHQAGGKTWGNDQRPLILASGVVVSTGGWHDSNGKGGIGARYSSDGGRTFGDVTDFVPGTGVGTNAQCGYSTGSYLVDPVDGSLHFLFYRLRTAAGSNWLNPADKDCTCWVAKASTFGADGSPNFTSVQQLLPYSPAAGQNAAWSLTYANPVRTPGGTWIVPVSYPYTSNGTFAVTIFRSTDRGTSWQQVPVEFTIPGGGFEVGVSETALAVRTDGSVLLLARGQGKGRYYMMTSQSTDDGQTWSPLTESKVLSVNTMPALSAGRPGDLQLNWSGHNSKGQASYWRNNLTMAHSQDGGASWNGYHDLIGATSLSVPGINPPGGAADNYYMRVMEADSVRIGSADRLFGWSTWNLAFPDGGPQTMYVEDEVRYLRDSHGALDTLNFRSSVGSLIGQGSELAHDRWWRVSGAGSLTLTDGARGASSALRMQAPAGSTVGASRLFPAIRRGRIRFRVRWAGVGSHLELAVQEGFGGEPQATGTVQVLRIAPDGSLLAPSAARGESTIGYLDNDVNPATGNLGGFGYEGNIALDYLRRSIGASFSTPAQLSEIRIADADGASRLTAADLSVWVSGTNNGDWTQLTDWTITGSAGSFTASGPTVSTRYVKIAQTKADTAFTFVNDKRVILSFTRALNPLPVPTTVPTNVYTTIDLGVDLPAGTVTVTVDGQDRGTVPVFAPAEVVTHLLMLGASGSAAVDTALDELIVQDTAAGLPALTSVGAATNL